MAFSDIEKNEKLKIIDIAIVETEEFKSNETFKNTFEVLSNVENKDRLFNTKYVVDETDAKKLLEEDKISGYLKLEENKPIITVKQSGINETILKHVVDEISQSEKISKDIGNFILDKYIGENPKEVTDVNSTAQKIYDEIVEIQTQNVKLEDISNKNLSYTMIEYYTLIAMACLYGGVIGMYAINQTLANMTNTGKRIAVSPTKKGTIVFSSILASFITQLIGLALLFIYTLFVLKVDYGDNLPLVILLGVVGSFAGLTLGVMISTIFKSNENTKTGIIIAVTMLASVFSGMMGITMKYLIDKNVPLLNKINPASMITDGFYSLYYYDTYDRFIFNIVSLLIFSSIMIILSYSSLRRQKYDSI